MHSICTCSMQQQEERHYQLLSLSNQLLRTVIPHHLKLHSWNASPTHFSIHRHLYSRLHYQTLCNPQLVCRKKRSRRWMTMTMMNTGTTIVTNMTFPTMFRLLLHQHQSQTKSQLSFLPDFTEHPKPKIHHAPKKTPLPPIPSTGGSSDDSNNDNDSNNDDTNCNSDEITFLHDFIAGGVAGSASVIVGHPFDTIKVRLQTSNATILSAIYEFGGITSLFRGMTAPLGAAAVINAIVFGSYGFSSRLYDKFIPPPPPPTQLSNTVDGTIPTHDPWHKAFLCGAFAGFVQCFVICPLEHIKCRLQIQVEPTKTSTPPKKMIASSEYYNGPIDAVYKITTQHGIHRLYQGWVSTLLREVPAFGLYFCTYDYLKDVANNILVQYWTEDATDTKTTVTTTPTPAIKTTSHTWIASAIAGGLSGSLTWAIVYPVDLIKSHIQTRSLTTPRTQLGMLYVARSIVHQHGISYLFRGLNITLLRALPVNGTIFPVYEFTLKQITLLGY